MEQPTPDAILEFARLELARLQAEQDAALTVLEDHRDIEQLESELTA